MRQNDIEQYQVWLPLVKQIQGFLTIARLDDLMAIISQNTPYQTQGIGFVVY